MVTKDFAPFQMYKLYSNFEIVDTNMCSDLSIGRASNLIKHMVSNNAQNEKSSTSKTTNIVFTSWTKNRKKNPHISVYTITCMQVLKLNLHQLWIYCYACSLKHYIVDYTFCCMVVVLMHMMLSNYLCAMKCYMQGHRLSFCWTINWRRKKISTTCTLSSKQNERWWFKLQTIPHALQSSNWIYQVTIKYLDDRK